MPRPLSHRLCKSAIDQVLRGHQPPLERSADRRVEGRNRLVPRRALARKRTSPPTSPKASQVFVEGRLQTRSYDDKDGSKVWTIEVVADDVNPLRRRAARGGADQTSTRKKLPAMRSAPARAPPPPPSAPPPSEEHQRRRRPLLMMSMFTWRGHFCFPVPGVLCRVETRLDAPWFF